MIARDILALALFSVIGLFGLMCVLRPGTVQRWALDIVRESGASEANAFQRRITAWMAMNEYVWNLRAVGAIAILMFILVVFALVH
jgi:hypothetical protein